MYVCKHYKPRKIVFCYDKFPINISYFVALLPSPQIFSMQLNFWTKKYSEDKQVFYENVIYYHYILRRFY